MRYTQYLKCAASTLFKNRVLPVYLVFFLTQRCNARCRHCLLGNTVPRPEAELTLAEIEKIARSMGDLAFLLPTGGEPFLRDDLAQIIRIFYRETNLRNVGIPTNGLLTQTIVKCAQEILAQCPQINLGIDISIDGVGQVHDQIRGVKGAFEKAVATYQQLKQLEKRQHHFNVNVETTISAFNQEYLPELYDYLTQKLKVNTLFTLLTRGSPREPLAKSVSVEKYQAYAYRLEQGIKNGCLSGYYNFPFCDIINAKRIVRHRLIAKTMRENRYQLPCLGGRLGAAITASGDVLACELLRDKAIGNLRDCDYDFRNIWFSQKADQLRQWIRSSKCFCTYECYHTLNILFNLQMYPQILKEFFLIKKAKISNFFKKGSRCIIT